MFMHIEDIACPCEGVTLGVGIWHSKVFVSQNAGCGSPTQSLDNNSEETPSSSSISSMSEEIANRS